MIRGAFLYAGHGIEETVKRSKAGRFEQTIDIETAKALYNSGMSLSQVAAQLGVTGAAISYAFKRNGFIVDRSKPKVLDSQLIDDANIGMSVTEISRKYGISQKALYKRADKLGISFNKGKSGTTTIIDVNELVKLVELGKTKPQIADELGVSVSTISRALKNNNIKLSVSRAWQNDEYRKSQINNSNSEYQRRLQDIVWLDNNIRARHSILMKEVWSNADYAHRQKIMQTAAWSDISKRAALSVKLSEVNICDSLGALYPNLLSQWDVSNDVDVYDVSPGSSRIVSWICSKDSSHRWQAAIKDRTRTDRPSVCPRCAHLSSRDEDMLVEYITSLGFTSQRNIRGLLQNPNLEIDIYVPDAKLGIEVCGEYWHREGNDKANVNRHYIKYVQAKDVGIRLLTIFRSELLNRSNAVYGYISSIFNKKRDLVVYARKCNVVEPDKNTMNAFLNKYHIQGATEYVHGYGLEYDGQLVATMTFSRSSGDDYILNRFCVPHDVHVPGAASKLLGCFTRNIDYNSIISFSDNRWSTGNLYDRLGFIKVADVDPSYWYFKLGGHISALEHKFKYRKDAIASKFGPLLDNETEYQAMLRFGYDRIWDCGKVKWVLK